MNTIIKVAEKLRVAITDREIQLNDDLPVNYHAYIDRIESFYEQRTTNKIKCDLTQIYGSYG